MDDGKVISAICPNCEAEVDLLITVLMDRFRPQCPCCKRGITIDRAWMLVEIARLQQLLRQNGTPTLRVARPGTRT